MRRTWQKFRSKISPKYRARLAEKVRFENAKTSLEVWMSDPEIRNAIDLERYRHPDHSDADYAELILRRLEAEHRGRKK